MTLTCLIGAIQRTVSRGNAAVFVFGLLIPPNAAFGLLTNRFVSLARAGVKELICTFSISLVVTECVLVCQLPHCCPQRSYYRSGRNADQEVGNHVNKTNIS
ncbi:hypothetical protein F5X96DRAFT_627667 [Biscogniauxia mediterranea]|nr:hypothetical protein F5X96DRAFT_627667 [Biscogniauxia mediterranea]